MSDARMATAAGALDDTAQWLTAAATQLDYRHKKQIAVDPEWTGLEIEDQHLKQLIEGLRACADNVRGAAAEAISVQVAPKPGPGRPEGGVNKASRELGIESTNVRGAAADAWLRSREA
jgi:hypothetical protein